MKVVSDVRCDSCTKEVKDSVKIDGGFHICFDCIRKGRRLMSEYLVNSVRSFEDIPKNKDFGE